MRSVNHVWDLYDIESILTLDSCKRFSELAQRDSKVLVPMLRIRHVKSSYQ